MTRVAAVQAAPAFMDLDGCLERVRGWVERARKEGAEMVVFGESWIPGYPAWLDCCRDVALWDHGPVKDVYCRLLENSATVPGFACDELSAIARDSSVVLVIGAHERVPEGPGRGTLYNTLLTFDADGSLLNRHRKIMPTFTERLIWGQGDGSTLHAVNTRAGRIGGLICWEHWMPPARQALHDSGEDVHVAAWPWVKEMSLVASRHYAFEGRTFVVACGAILRAGDLPHALELTPELKANPDQFVLRGGTAIISPRGDVIAGPALDHECLVVADLDYSLIAKESLALDVTGHYSRPDLFEFRLKS